MQRSFSVVHDDDDDDDDELPIERDWSNEEQTVEKSKKPDEMLEIKDEQRDHLKFDALLDEISNMPSGDIEKKLLSHDNIAGKLPHADFINNKVPSAKKLVSSDSEDSDNDEKRKIPGEYDPKQYEHLEVNDDVKNVFQYINKYIPQNLTLDYKFRPFVPEYLPAVGDIDAFLKVLPPKETINGESFDEKSLKLGLAVLDEPSTNQSDPALLYLKMKAMSADPGKKDQGNVVVKKVDDLDKNGKVVDKWIKDISDLHKSKSSVIVRYSEPMPDIDDLMQQWPEEVESKIKEKGFPEPGDMSLTEYIDKVCSLFQIPIGTRKIQSLHLLFSLYAAIKQTQLYQASSTLNDKSQGYSGLDKKADQLVLD